MTDAKYEVVSQTTEVLLSPGTTQFEVPPFQRKYAWGAEEINQLIDDIFGETSSTDLPYFLGSIVLAVRDGARSSEPLLVLDGQQRLTTLSLIIAVLICKMKENGASDADEHRMYLFSRRLKGSKRPKVLLQAEDLKTYENIIINPNIINDNINIKRTSIGIATAKIFSAIAKYKDQYSSSNNEVESYENMLERLLYDVEIVRIKAPSEKDAFRLFETLNDRGLALSAADLIKNKLFSHCGSEIDDAFDAWSNMIALTKDDDVVNFLRYYWIAAYSFARKKGLYDIYKNHINKLNGTTATLFTLELEEAAKDYEQIINPIVKTCTWGSYVAESLERINTYRARSCRSVMLACSKYHETEVRKIVDICESISVRYSVVGEKNPNQLEKLYSEVSKVLRENKNPFEIINKLDLFKDIPSDEEFLKKLESSDITSVTPAWREVLVKLNSALSTGETKVESRLRVHVEHIFPQNPRATALTESGLTQETSADYINKLGDLTLLSGRRNRELSNKPFSQKKTVYLNSEIAMTKVLSKYDIWNSKAIIERTKELAIIAVKVYPHPRTILS